mgnify:CR=1 FL=1|tara:strand:- start:648 stop:2225 length:1578 start_codon:yes stop_codon:yes gene_type:complete
MKKDKKKRKVCNNHNDIEDKKRKIINSDNYISDSDDSSESDIDENGNIKNLIDDDIDDYIDDIDDDIDYDIDDDIDYDDIDDIDEELFIGKLICKYINKKIVKNEKDELNRYEEILKKYDKPMRTYFLDLEEDKRDELLSIENEIKSINNTVIPLRFQLLTSNLNTDIKAIAIRKIENLSKMDPSSNEYYKTKNWVEGLLQIPFGIYKDLPINIKTNSKDEITEYLLDANRILNKAVFGHKKAKCQILQIVSQWISNPQSKGSVFAITGPMGNGKTTLVKEGISKMINRPFEFISLGGATDSCYLDGHSYTYEGSIPGKIIDIVKKAKCMNPVIYFDELDKVSDTPKGDEIINLLIHLTDFSQNDHFNDKYYNNIPIDLSKALFIFSLNNLEKVNPILRDRMFMIQTNELKEEEKLVVAKNYLIKGILKEIGLESTDFIFSDDIIRFIINSYSQEQGVRNLKRTLETIIGKINIIRITKKESIKNLELPFEIDDFEFPLKITENIVKKLVEPITLTENLPDFMYT